jgi:hypothetical protein
MFFSIFNSITDWISFLSTTETQSQCYLHCLILDWLTSVRKTILVLSIILLIRLIQRSIVNHSGYKKLVYFRNGSASLQHALGFLSLLHLHRLSGNDFQRLRSLSFRARRLVAFMYTTYKGGAPLLPRFHQGQQSAKTSHWSVSQLLIADSRSSV